MMKRKNSLITWAGLVLFLPSFLMAGSFWVGLFSKGTAYSEQTFISSVKLHKINE